MPEVGAKAPHEQSQPAAAEERADSRSMEKALEVSMDSSSTRANSATALQKRQVPYWDV